GLGAVAASPDGEELAYVTPDGPAQWALWAVMVAGGGRRPILRHQDGVVTSVAWSPRGDVLAYSGAQTTGGQPSNPRIWLVRSDGSQSNLVYGRGREAGSAPIWSPDGQRLAFYENHFGALAIYNFTRSLQTVPSDGQETGSWSPDGAGLVYLDRTGATNAQSVLKVADVGRPGAMVSAGGSPSTRQITEGPGNVFNPSWSPTGG